MEYIQAISEVGLPGFSILAILLAGRAVWNFYQNTYWPYFCQRQQLDAERREREAKRDADQTTWLVEKLADVSANLQRVADRMDRLERACQEKGLIQINREN